MDTSSPLAAMRPPPPLFGQQNMFGSDHRLLAANGLRAGARGQLFRNRNRNMDYFNVKPVHHHGSSPTVSLAADLSQNFRINEASPQMATPRRALFTKTMLEAMETRANATTPPLPPSSSPVPLSEMMDITPLPHKMPFATHLDVPSPTPAQSPADEIMVDSPPESRPAEPRPAVAERRKATLRRPSLTRAKGYSTGAMAHRLPPADNEPPPFLFGPTSAFAAAPVADMPLSACFNVSPSQDRRPQTANSPSQSAVRPKSHFGSLSGMGSGVRNGSPITAHSRRPSNPFLRPRKLCRRSLSMFESPGDVLRIKKEPTPPSSLQCVVDVNEPHVPALPHHFPDGNNDSIPRISRETMLALLDGKYADHFDHTMIIDCRFEYEYDGGHITGAINYNDKELLSSHLFAKPKARALLIFHCEYSAHRAPIMARHVRAEDRTFNVESYPRLTYPDVYILEGGYSGFFAEHADRCYPQAYVEMDDTAHVKTCERELDRLRQHNRKGLHRAQTFAFGEHPHPYHSERLVDDSPTAPGRVVSGRGPHGGGGIFGSPLVARDIMKEIDSPFSLGPSPIRNLRDYDSSDMMIGASPIMGTDRGHTRRMVSF